MSVHEDIVASMMAVVDSVGESESVSASIVANKAIDQYLRGDESIQVQYLSLEHAKQMARVVLRKRWPTLEQQAERAAIGQADLFEEELQDRYSVKRNGDDLYVPRHMLSLLECKSIHKRIMRISDKWRHHGNAFAAFVYDLHGLPVT